MDLPRRQHDAFMSDLASITGLHREGLARVSKIVDANPNYDELLEYRLSSPEWAAFAQAASLAHARQLAIAMFEQKFRSRRHKIILPEFPGIACDGKTHNNLREFRFFERICSPVSISERNYGHCQTVSASNLQPTETAVQEAIVADVIGFYSERTDIAASLVRQQILYSHSFFSFLLSFTRPGAMFPSVLIQANDHSPGHVALSMVFKGLGVPRVYLQHAEVTQNFPALDFEYSVLHNEQSRQTYKAIAPPVGQVYVIPRSDTIFARERLSAERGDGVTVVIYPTSRVLFKELNAMLTALNGNPAVGKVLIKQHPGAAKRLDTALKDVAIELVDELPDGDHIAIVGNSSVAIELLHKGIPVYQSFGFDPVKRDYYGLVARGVTQEVTKSELGGRFWRPYAITSEWLELYGQLDPTTAMDYEAEQVAFVAEMQRLAAQAAPAPASTTRPMNGRLRARIKALVKRLAVLAININKPLATKCANLILTASHRFGTFLTVNSYYAAVFLQTRLKMDIEAPVWSGAQRGGAGGAARAELVGLLEETFADLRSPANWIRRNETVKAYDSETIIATVEAMFQNRRPELNTVFQGYPEWPAGSDVGTWIYLKKAEWGNIALEQDELGRIAAFVYGYSGDTRVRALLERSLINEILRSGSCALLDAFWQNASVIRLDNLNLNTKVALLNKLRSLPGREAEAERMLADIGAGATPFEQLKLANMEFLARRPVAGWSHAHAEDAFGRLAPLQIAKDFAADVRPIYDALRPRMRYMDARASKTEADELIGRLRAAIEDKRPFSLVRLSDGEGYLFPDGRHFTSADAANRERHWWGTELPAELRETIIAEARRAVASADVVGIPAIYRFVRDYGDNASSLNQTVQGRGLLQVLGGIADLAAREALLTEDKINVALFTEVEEVTRLADVAQKLVIVSSAKPESLPPTLTLGRKVELIAIPTHHKTSLNDKYHSSSDALPFVYESVLSAIDDIVEPGSLVLVAGGLVGKIFVGRGRDKGAVVVDIGHTLDDWMHERRTSLR